MKRILEYIQWQIFTIVGCVGLIIISLLDQKLFLSVLVESGEKAKKSLKQIEHKENQ